MEQKKNEKFFPGDLVRVYLKVSEGDKEHSQVFEGTVIARKGSGTNESFTVRKVSYGIGVEKVLPLYSPSIDKIKVLKHGKVKRAKLYYLRGKSEREGRIEERKHIEEKKHEVQIGSHGGGDSN